MSRTSNIDNNYSDFNELITFPRAFKGFMLLFLANNLHICRIMKQAIAKMTLVSPYCQSRFHGTPKKNKELAADYELRTWRERLHYDPKTKEIFIPALALANCLKEAAKFLAIQIPGKGKTQYTKHFEAGVNVIDDVSTGRTYDEAVEQKMFVPSDGKRGGGKRVMKVFPLLQPPLSFEATYLIADDVITAEVFAHHLRQAGTLIGIGAFRVRNQGIYGRFEVNSIDWIEKTTSTALPPINYRRAA